VIGYRCKCGRITAWGSMPPDRCRPCLKCNSTLAAHPDGHGEPQPHEFVAHDVATDAGPQPLSRCRTCQRTKAEIERDDAEERATP
jgi:hypothetical protein